MDRTHIVVEGVVPSRSDDTNLRDGVWSLALDQRAFGPRKLLVAFADRRGRFRGMSVAPRTDPPELALGPCAEHLGAGADAAVALCDEPVHDGPPPADLAERFVLAREVMSEYGIHLVDWIACDDDLFRSTRFALHPKTRWWDVPPRGKRTRRAG